MDLADEPVSIPAIIGYLKISLRGLGYVGLYGCGWILRVWKGVEYWLRKLFRLRLTWKPRVYRVCTKQENVLKTPDMFIVGLLDW